MAREHNPQRHATLTSIQKSVFRVELILIVTLALVMGCAGTMINMKHETQKRDRNLQNVAETIAQSPILLETDDALLMEYLDSVKDTAWMIST